MSRIFGAALAVALLAAGAAAAQQPPPSPAMPKSDPTLPAFRTLYKELVETNTEASDGDCTLAAQRVAARMKAAGFPEKDLDVFTAPNFPKNGGLIAVYPGTDPRAKAVLLLAHIDVVEAKREDWTRDPFTLVEEGGYFYARGSSDDKAQAAIWADTLIRLHAQGFKPKRTIKMALTCGEEGGSPFNGAYWLTQNRREQIDAAFALNEGGGGQLDEHSKRVSHSVEAGEKSVGGYTLLVTNPGGHSSRPVPDNAIYRLSDALGRIAHYRFPVTLNDVTTGYLTRMSKIVGGEQGQAMAALAANPADAKADALLSADPSLNAILRTTCVATMLSGGHAPNALPQRATATINCRIFPGVSRDQVRATLVKVVDDPQVSVTDARGGPPVGSDAGPPMTREVMGPIEKITADMWPGVPVVPTLLAAATDGKALMAAGIPTYGVSGIFFEPDLGHIHGLNERVGVQSLYEGREFLYRLVKAYADQ
jgi:acetylornithine deacetylase/succinyl-diaminopimelate desuccinylase-like protein